MTLNDYISRMNQRERILAGSVGGILFLFVNVFIWSWLLGAISHGREQLTDRQAQRKQQAIFLQERELWIKRDQWLQEHQPAFKSQGEASTLLDQQLRPIAAKYDVILENPSIGTGESTPDHQSVWAQIETSSSWEKLVQFLYDVQQPEGFVVFENVTLGIDTRDASKMKGKFKVARWYAPNSTARK
jgi:hypothetical protein